MNVECIQKGVIVQWLGDVSKRLSLLFFCFKQQFFPLLFLGYRNKVDLIIPETAINAQSGQKGIQMLIMYLIQSLLKLNHEFMISSLVPQTFPPFFSVHLRQTQKLSVRQLEKAFVYRLYLLKAETIPLALQNILHSLYYRSKQLLSTIVLPLDIFLEYLCLCRFGFFLWRVFLLLFPGEVVFEGKDGESCQAKDDLFLVSFVLEE